MIKDRCLLSYRLIKNFKSNNTYNNNETMYTFGKMSKMSYVVYVESSEGFVCLHEAQKHLRVAAWNRKSPEILIFRQMKKKAKAYFELAR